MSEVFMCDKCDEIRDVDKKADFIDLRMDGKDLDFCEECGSEIQGLIIENGEVKSKEALKDDR